MNTSEMGGSTPFRGGVEPLRPPMVSIVIPVRTLTPDLRETLTKLRDLDYPNFEVLVFTDGPVAEAFPKTTFISSGVPTPAEKRNLALKYARGEIIAFLDDDSYPDPAWLREAVPYFADSQVGGVCGPGVTPPSDGLLEQASGKVFGSWLASYKAILRYRACPKTEVDDFPSVNLLVRSSDFRQVGGFIEGFWPGEDTKLCLDLTKGLGKKIIYDPKVLVWHHRRALFKDHLKQVWRYANHRGYYSKIFPETSRRLIYLVPSLFVLGLVMGPLASLVLGQIGSMWLASFLAAVYLGFLALYAFLLLWEGLATRSLVLAPLVMLGIFLTHLAYGFGFLRGLFLRPQLKPHEVRGDTYIGG